MVCFILNNLYFLRLTRKSKQKPVFVCIWSDDCYCMIFAHTHSYTKEGLLGIAFARKKLMNIEKDLLIMPRDTFNKEQSCTPNTQFTFSRNTKLPFLHLFGSCQWSWIDEWIGPSSLHHLQTVKSLSNCPLLHLFALALFGLRLKGRVEWFRLWDEEQTFKCFFSDFFLHSSLILYLLRISTKLNLSS